MIPSFSETRARNPTVAVARTLGKLLLKPASLPVRHYANRFQVLVVTNGNVSNTSVQLR